ncbi:hypothetical protein KAR10_03085 [bacterium]|nr:hypothetical protein [bacterium]
MKEDKGKPLDLIINHSDIKIEPAYLLVDFRVDDKPIFSVNRDGELIGSDGEKVGQLNKEDIDRLSKYS